MIRRLHVAFTVLLAAALAASIWLSARDRRDALEQVRSKTQENAVLRKRAETAEANTRLVIDRFA